ncbi:MAG TPA: hypothetical protein DCS43_04775 [Verrucomicrobia bacterium]|nr:hypothetical protein [Verrucomicrobiota bacterium]
MAKLTTIAAATILLWIPGRLLADDAPRVETVRHQGITLTMTLTPGSISLDRDVVLTLALTHPAHLAVTFPSIADRLQGLLPAASFDRDLTPTNSATVSRERVIRLTPLIASEYRIAPMAVAYRDAVNGGDDSGYFATPPIVLPVNAVSDKPVDETLRGTIEPIPIRPSLKTLSGYAAILIGIVLLMALAIYLLGRIQRQIRVMRMSPRERALHELELLLGKKWVEHGRVKDFYVELTMIVRRYIERQHHVRAPEQTTYEFLQAITADPRFPSDVLGRLKEFLEAADLVKFAAAQPDAADVNNAVSTARDYVSSDAAGNEAPETSQTPGKEC